MYEKCAQFPVTIHHRTSDRVGRRSTTHERTITILKKRREPSITIRFVGFGDYSDGFTANGRNACARARDWCIYESRVFACGTRAAVVCKIFRFADNKYYVGRGGNDDDVRA